MNAARRRDAIVFSTLLGLAGIGAYSAASHMRNTPTEAEDVVHCCEMPFQEAPLLRDYRDLLAAG
jgi:hypothetical protein